MMEEKKVILASSLGTVFEWYDFYLYGSLATIIGAQFFSAFDVTTRNVFAPPGLRGRLPGAPLRRHLLRPHRRSRRPEIHLPRHDPDHGLLDLPGRPSAELRPDRLVAPAPARSRASRSAARRRRSTWPSTLPGRRGFYTSFIQITATVGLLLSLVVILVLRTWMGEQGFQTGEGWPIAGWRIPFLLR